MYNDTQSAKLFDRMHARDRLAEEARHVGEVNNAQLYGAHIAGERKAQRLMSVFAIGAVGLVAVLALLGF
jgi:hypothetical protein